MSKPNSLVETLSLRVERHNQNALALAIWLQEQPHVSYVPSLIPANEFRWVNYPGLPEHPHHAIALKQFRKDHFGGVLSFGVKGDASQGAKVVDNLQLASNLANVGDAKTVSSRRRPRFSLKRLACHPSLYYDPLSVIGQGKGVIWYSERCHPSQCRY